MIFDSYRNTIFKIENQYIHQFENFIQDDIIYSILLIFNFYMLFIKIHAITTNYNFLYQCFIFLDNGE
ncbi:MAG: hypothetical protein K0R06_756 [Clostridium sp.]|jgi:hypothetical protein|nr:hypothetical protein [Clostridium sp.]